MHRRWSLLLLFALLLAACGDPRQSAGTGTSAGTAAARPAVATPPTARRAPTAASGPGVVTAPPAPPLPAAFPALDAGQQYVYVVDYYRTIRVVDPRAAAIAHELPVGHAALPVFSPDGSHLYVTHAGTTAGSTGGRLDIFEVAGGRRIAGVDGLELMAYKIWGPPIAAPARDGRTVYLHGRRITSGPGEIGRDVCWIYTFDVGADRLAPETIPLPACRVAPLLLSADGRTLYSGPWLIDLAAWPATVRENPDLAGRAVVQSADGRWLYALDRGGNVAVWDADARQVVRTIPGAVPAYGYQSLYLSRDGTRLSIATDDGDIHNHTFKGVVTLDSATGERIGELRTEREFRSFTMSVDELEYYLIAWHRSASGTLVVHPASLV